MKDQDNRTFETWMIKKHAKMGCMKRSWTLDGVHITKSRPLVPITNLRPRVLITN